MGTECGMKGYSMAGRRRADRHIKRHDWEPTPRELVLETPSQCAGTACGAPISHIWLMVSLLGGSAPKGCFAFSYVQWDGAAVLAGWLVGGCDVAWSQQDCCGFLSEEAAAWR